MEIECPMCNSTDLENGGVAYKVGDVYHGELFTCNNCKSELEIGIRDAEPNANKIIYRRVLLTTCDKDIKEYAKKRCKEVFGIEADYYIEECINEIEERVSDGYLMNEYSVDDWIYHECRVAKGHDD